MSSINYDGQQSGLHFYNSLIKKYLFYFIPFEIISYHYDWTKKVI
jgi:hypothetical protein